MIQMSNIPVCRSLIVALAAVFFSGCSSAPATIDMSPDAEVTFDGLHPIIGGRMQQAWARPDFDISTYSKVMLQGADAEFRPGGQNPRQNRALGPNEHFAVTPEQKVRFQELMSAAFVEELSLSEHFTIVTEPAPDVLLIQGILLDVVSFIPEQRAGRSEVFLSRIGEVTLVLEIRDSVSGAVLLRAAERRAAETTGTGFTRSNTVTNSAEFRRVARRWAMVLREGLDEFMAPAESASE